MPLRLPEGVAPLMFRSTEYVESEDSPKGGYYFDRGQVTCRIMVDHMARAQAVLDFAGSVQVNYDGGGQGYLTRVLPHALPARPWMYVQAVPNEEPLGLRGVTDEFGDGTGQSVYDLCELTLNYVMPTYKLKEDDDVLASTGPLAGKPDEGYALQEGYQDSRYVTRVKKYSSRILVLNKGMLKDQDGKIIVEGVPFPEPGGEVQYTWHQVPEECLPELVWMANSGRVNDATFDGYPAGTLLFDGNVEVRPSPNPITGQVLTDVVYRFKLAFKADPADGTIYGHNYVYRLVTNPPALARLRPRLVTTDAVGSALGSRMFPNLDFKKLFRPQPLAP